MTRIFFRCFLFIICCASATAAQSFRGVVSGIVDGRTVTIKTEVGGEIRAMIAFIEVPDAKQPLSQIVFDHLSKLVLGKNVRFAQTRTYSQGVLGALYLISPSGDDSGGTNEINIAVQMLRDGAAWFDVPEYGTSPDRSLYQEVETIARSEKRGVWGIQGLKPAWQFRDEEFQKLTEQKRAERERNAKLKPRADTLWADVGSVDGGNGKNGGYAGLQSNYDKFTDETHVWTNESVVSFTGDVAGSVLLVSSGEYFQGTDAKHAAKRRYTLSFHASGHQLLIPTGPELRLIGAGGERVLITHSELGFPRENYVKQREDHIFDDSDRSYTYEMSEAQFKAIRSGASFRFGIWEGTLPTALLSSLP